MSENYSPEKVSDIMLVHLGSAIFVLCSTCLFTIHKHFAIRSLTQTPKMASEWKLESSSYILNVSQSHSLLSQFPTEGIFFPTVCRGKEGPISLRKMLISPASGIDLSSAPVVNTSKQTCALLKLCFKVWQNRTLISTDVLSA